MSRAEPLRGQDVAGALRVDPRGELGDARGALGDEVVGRAEGVEVVVAVGQQVLPALLREADRVGEHAQRETPGRWSGRRRTPASRRRLGENLVDEVARHRPASGRAAGAATAGERIFCSTRRGASWCGGSASSSTLGGRHGFS